MGGSLLCALREGNQSCGQQLFCAGRSRVAGLDLAGLGFSAGYLNSR